MLSAVSPALWPNLPKLLCLVGLVVAAIGIWIAKPRLRKASAAYNNPPQEVATSTPSAFIRGAVTDSSIERVVTDADFFIDGDVHSSKVEGILQNKRNRKP